MTETISKGAANQAGARIDTDAYAKAGDFLPIEGIDHVEFWVGNARQAAAYYRALWGFTPVAFSGLETKVRDRASYAMVQNGIRFVFTAPLVPDGEIAEHVREHGDGVHDIAFAVSDVASAWRETTSRGAVSALQPREFDGGEDEEISPLVVLLIGATQAGQDGFGKVKFVHPPGRYRIKGMSAKLGPGRRWVKLSHSHRAGIGR
jgi:4-hydroxyphenylpyruvate dioxygenase-like putative hemolysin